MYEPEERMNSIREAAAAGRPGNTPHSHAKRRRHRREEVTSRHRPSAGTAQSVAGQGCVSRRQAHVKCLPANIVPNGELQFMTRHHWMMAASLGIVTSWAV